MGSSSSNPFHSVENAFHEASKGIDKMIGTNMGGSNKGGYLNQVIKTVEAYNPTKMLSDLVTGKNPLDDMKSTMTDLARKTGLGFDFRQKQPAQSGGSNSASTAVSNLASAKTNEASATNKANALDIGYNIGDKANAKAKQLGSLNAGRISEDEQANQNSLLLKKLKKAGNSSSFSNDFIR